MSLETTYERYSPLLDPGDLTEGDLLATDTSLRQTNFREMNAWTEDHLELHKLPNGQEFRMVVDRPNDYDPDQVLIVAGEYGKGTDPDHIMRALDVRRMAAPHAAIVYQPPANADHPWDYMNFSKEERRTLRKPGDHRFDPLMGRFALVLSSLGDPSTQTVYGSSQGGTVALNYAAHGDTPQAAVAVFEPPNVANRSVRELMFDFLGNSGQLQERFHENHDMPDPEFIQDVIAAQSLGGFIKFGRGLIVPESLAMVNIMRVASAQAQMEAILAKNGSVVHAYGTVDKVSPEADNERIAKALRGNSKYRDVRIPGVGHEGSILYAFNGALARTARRLIDQSAE